TIMTALRQRKGSKGKELSQENQRPDPAVELSQHSPTGLWTWWTIIWGTFGAIIGVSLGLLSCIYVATLHENDLWFSNIKEVEREISFRTECGLYYSYYKQMLLAPSIQQGLYELINDNSTESKRTINLLQRMNIYQEVLLSILYRLLPIQNYLEPVYFYIYTVFALQAVYVIALYITSWLLSGSWLAGVLTAAWYIINRVDTTRVEFTISLRENWSLPFFALQVAAITCYLRPHLKPVQQKVALWLVFLSSLCFCLTWQFNQFILLVQALLIFGLDCLDLISHEQATSLYLVQAASLLMVWALQFCNPMILGSLALSFIVSALFVRSCQKDVKAGGLLLRLGKLLLHCLLVLSLTLTLNYLTKNMLQLRSDEHIFKFIKAKFGLGSTRDFDAKLYLCEEAFGLLPLDTFERLAGTLIVYPYLCTLGVLLLILMMVVMGNLRMKYLWTGHMCAFAAYGICGKELWGLYLKVIHCHSQTKFIAFLSVNPLSFVLVSFFLLHAFTKFWPKLMEEISELREFYDPDTVELMTWISMTKTRGSGSRPGARARDAFVRTMPLRHWICVIKDGARSSSVTRDLMCLSDLITPPPPSAGGHPVMVDEQPGNSTDRCDRVPSLLRGPLSHHSKTSKKAVFAGSMQLLAGIKLCTGRILTNHPHYEDRALRERTKQYVSTWQVYQIYAQQAPEEVHRILRAAGADYVVLEDSICYERRHSRGCRLRDLLDVANGHIMDGPGDNDPDLVPAPNPRFCDEIKKDDPTFTSLFSRVFRNKTFHVYKLKKGKKRTKASRTGEYSRDSQAHRQTQWGLTLGQSPIPRVQW
ncbi:hypothetical protein JZ751_020938, partial [Albula glossodonta]